MPLIDIEGALVVECDGDDTILRASLRSGVGFPYGCNVGSCGTCRFELLDGRVEHAEGGATAWSDRDRERGRWLGCRARPVDDCLVKVRLDPAPILRPTRMRARLKEARSLTHDVREFAFLVDGPDTFLPGQYALLHVPDVPGPRPYSMCNLAGTGEWRFHVKRVPGGSASAVLFDRMSQGDSIMIDGPYGHAYLRDRPGDLLLVAGGSGLSQMISIARAATTTSVRPGRHVSFYLGGRQPHDLCAEPMLAALPGYGTLLRYVGAVSEPSPGWTGPSGYIHEVVQDDLEAQLRGLEVYFAGPPPMVRAMQMMLHDGGVERDRIHFDEVG